MIEKINNLKKLFSEKFKILSSFLKKIQAFIGKHYLFFLVLFIGSQIFWVNFNNYLIEENNKEGSENFNYKIEISKLEKTIEKTNSELSDLNKEHEMVSSAAYKKYVDTNSKLSFLYVAKNDRTDFPDEFRDVEITKAGNTIKIDDIFKIQIFEKSIDQSLTEAIKDKVLTKSLDKCIAINIDNKQKADYPTGWDQYARISYIGEDPSSGNDWEYAKSINCPVDYLNWGPESMGYFIANNNSNLFFYIYAPRGPMEPPVTLWEESLKIDR